MAKQRKRRADETAALFVRLPLEEAEKLDRFAFERRMPKRDVVRRLVAERLDDADVLWHRPAPPPVHDAAPAATPRWSSAAPTSCPAPARRC